MNIAQLLRARLDRRLRPDDYRVLLQLQLDLDVEEYRPVKVNAIARTLGMGFSQAARAVRHLTAFGYLAKGKRDGTLKTYRLRTPVLSDTAVTSQAA